jgi:hypothetical protein
VNGYVLSDGRADVCIEGAEPLAYGLIAAGGSVEGAPELGDMLGHTLGVYLKRYTPQGGYRLRPLTRSIRSRRVQLRLQTPRRPRETSRIAGVPALRSRRSEVRILCGAPENKGDLSAQTESHDNRVTAAERLLVAVADGASDAIELARQLAELDIDARGGRAALDVLRGDEFALVRAVEIARGIVEELSQEPAKRKGAGRGRL